VARAGRELDNRILAGGASQAASDDREEEAQMRGRAKAIKALAVVAMIISSLSVPAHAQIGQNGGAYRGPPVVEHPKIDEKAYKAALDRIPKPTKKYDLAAAGRGKAGVVGEHPGLAVELGDVDHIRPDGATQNREIVGLVADRQCGGFGAGLTSIVRSPMRVAPNRL
jgi:hypothetical protein